MVKKDIKKYFIHYRPLFIIPQSKFDSFGFKREDFFLTITNDFITKYFFLALMFLVFPAIVLSLSIAGRHLEI